MKTILSLAIACMFVCNAGAQTPLNPTMGEQFGGKQTLSIYVPSPKIRAYSYRLNGVVTDSTNYYYDKTNGSSFFANCNENATMRGRPNDLTNKLNIFCDSFISYDFDPSTGAIVSSYAVAASYQGNNLIETKFYYPDEVLSRPNKVSRVYTGTYNDNLLTNTSMYDTSGSGYLRLFFNTTTRFDTAKRPIFDSMFYVVNNDPFELTFSYYRSRYDSTVVRKYLGSLNTYLPYRTLVRKYNEYGNLTQSVSYSNDSPDQSKGVVNLTYQEGNQNYLSREELIYSNPTTLGRRTFWEYTLDSLGRWASFYLYQWDYDKKRSYLAERDYYFYNEFSLIDHRLGYWYDTSTKLFADTAYDKSVYYYEKYYNEEDAKSCDVRLGFYPNPTTGALHLTSDVALTASYNAVVYDISGKEIFQRYIDSWGKAGYLDLSSLYSGVYVIKVFNRYRGCEISSLKIVKY